MRLHQLDVDRYQPLMQTGEHQRQEQPREQRSHQQPALVDRQIGAVGDGVGDNAADRLQNQDRQRGGDQRGQQWVRISSTDSGSSVRRRFSTQHINATTSSTAITPPRPGCNASPNNVICASAGLERMPAMTPPIA